MLKFKHQHGLLNINLYPVGGVFKLQHMTYENILFEQKKIKLGSIEDFVENKTELFGH